QARDLVYKNEGKRCVVVLPRHIEPFVLEAYLLENKKAVSGVEIHKISSLARNMMSKISVGQRLKRVDQVALSEHFESDYTRGITRTLLNSVLELRQSYFDIGYLESLFASKVGAEYPMLLKVFKKYEDFLKAEGLSDDADFNRAFVDVLSDPVRSSIIPSDTVVLFAGFTEYTSTDLALIAAVSKNVDECYMVGPDLFIDGLDYSRVLKESLASMDFDIQKIEGSRNAGIKLFELKSPTEEVCHISNSIPDGVKASIYTSSDLDIYYSLFKYFMHDKVSVRSSVRLDRSKILSVLLGLIKLKGTDWEYRDIYRLMSYQNLWNDHVQIRKLMSFIAERGLFPSDKDYFVQLEAKQVVDLINAVAETIPAKAKPLAYVSAINELINKLNLREKLSVSDKFELSTVENLIYRVTSALDNNKELNTEEFCRKLSVHAEENYLVRGLPYFTDVTLSASRLISSNTTENVWFVGMNQEKARSNAAEDLIIKDSFILSLRAENFIRPTSRESRALEDKMICDAVKGSNVTYVSNMGDPLDCLKGLEKEEVNTKVPICSGYFADLANTATIIKDHQSKSVSPTAIETYIECPYRYFASKVIKVERSEADELTPSASIQGQIAHEALEKLLPVYLKDTKIDIHSEIE
ncbi:MAG: PD-(D/E)XK nuclease family protein, partial [bacterium]